MHADKPFSAAHSPRFLLVTEAWRECLARLEARFGEREPFLLVTGEPGTGKTAFVLHAIEQWGGRAHAITLANPALTRNELLEEIALRLGARPAAGASKPQLLACLGDALAGSAARGRVPVLVVDDAHQLADGLLEELQLLANSEAREGRPLEIVLVGPPALEERLAGPGLVSLRQRVAVHCRIGPLSAKETRSYVHHRARAAGLDGPRLFPRRTCAELHERARGVPRVVNRLAAEALRHAGRDGAAAVTAEHVQAAEATLNGVADERPAVEPVPEPGPPSANPAPQAVKLEPPTGKQEPPSAKPERPAVKRERQAVKPEPPAVMPVPPAAKPSPPTAKQEPPAARPEPPLAADPPHHGPVGAAALSAAPSAHADSPAPPRASGSSAAFRSDSAARADSSASLWASAAGGDEARVKDWVTRFIGDAGPPRIGSAFAAGLPSESEVPAAATPRRARSAAHAMSDRETEAMEPADGDAPVEAPRHPRTAPPRRRDGRARWVAPVTSTAALGLAALVIVFVLVRAPRPAGRSGEDPATAPPRPAVAAVAPAVAAVTSPDPALAQGPPGAVPMAPVTQAVRSAAAAAAPARPLPEPAAPGTAPPDTVVARREDAPNRFALEVGTYLAEERAVAERNRIAAAVGLDAWVVRGSDYGADSYRVVLGVYRTAGRAEAAAVNLLDRGLVGEARVVPLPPRRDRR